VKLQIPSRLLIGRGKERNASGWNEAKNRGGTVLPKWRSGVQLLRETMNLSRLQNDQTDCGARPASSFLSTGALQGPEADRAPLSRTKVKNTWIFPHAPAWHAARQTYILFPDSVLIRNKHMSCFQPITQLLTHTYPPRPYLWVTRHIFLIHRSCN
jgi:hypothetical protein